MPERTNRATESEARGSRTRVTDQGDGGVRLNVPIIGQVRVPHVDHLAFYGGLAALAELQILEWPVALVLGAGQALAESQHNRVVRGFGDALSEA
ncbi:hypothetical protein [Mycobacterium sp. E2733]|uniref:hypothetical protein n=1 Tax=Mycobacterium sp. E2733 TaxID=1834138 RepID=UPI0007FBA008|nr:hypothetical protein [Mycobacterium sp. E2733]OBH93280.1 hypothetical protein A5678_06520 [Mycobacterium sp. E2733]